MELENPQAQSERLGEPEPLFAFKTKSGTWWLLYDEQLEQLRDEFPDVDIEAQCAKAWSWTYQRPSRRKTPRGMPKFLRTWMGREN